MYSAIQTGNAVGMTTLDQYLLDILSKGLIAKQDARAKAVNKDSFR